MMKGQIESTPIIMIIIFITGIALLFSFLLISELGTNLEQNEQTNTTEIGIIISNGEAALTTIDVMMVILLVGLVFAAVISGFLVKSHPIFLIPILLVAGFIIFFGVALSNVWDEVTSDTTLNTTADSLPITDFLNNEWPKLALVIVVLGSIALFAKSTLGGESL